MNAVADGSKGLLYLFISPLSTTLRGKDVRGEIG
jgi:hypothetical protein